MNPPVLRDIHLPDASLWWPPAAGWWVVLILIVLLALLLPRLWRWIRHKPLKRVSMRQFERICQQHKAGQSDRLVLGEITALLRRVTISYYGRRVAAAATGEQWQHQLQQLAGDAGFSAEQLELLVRGRYQAQADLDIESLLQASERWLHGLPRSGEHVSA
jgi:hypothetical protein